MVALISERMNFTSSTVVFQPIANCNQRSDEENAVAILLHNLHVHVHEL